MAKNREAVTCNGRAAFYAAMWDDIRQCAMDCGWAVALHGSLASDMDIVAMPWVKEARSFNWLIEKIANLFTGNHLVECSQITYGEKPHGRIVASIPIWADFYLDISTMDTAKAKYGRWVWKELHNDGSLTLCCSECLETQGAGTANYCPYCGADMQGGFEDV